METTKIALFKGGINKNGFRGKRRAVVGLALVAAEARKMDSFGILTFG